MIRFEVGEIFLEVEQVLDTALFLRFVRSQNRTPLFQVPALTKLGTENYFCIIPYDYIYIVQAAIITLYM